MAANSVADRLAHLRGGVPAGRHNARTIAALTSNPGCARRAVLDAAGVDKPALAAQVGQPSRHGQSPFAIARGLAFEARLKADGYAALLEQIAQRLGMAATPGGILDLARSVADGATNEQRYAATRAAFAAATAAIVDHPMLRLDVAGVPVYLEPDLVACRFADRLHIVEIKSFPILDGQADPAKVNAAAGQAAVYVLALRALLTEAGRDPAEVSTDALLVCPKDFGNSPAVSVLDLRRQLAVLRRQLARMADVSQLVSDVPAGLTFDLTRPAGELAAAVAAVPARYTPDCLADCDMAYFCRAEARGSTAALGAPVREQLGGVTDVAVVLSLASGERRPDDDQAEAAAMLRAAARLRAEALG